MTPPPRFGEGKVFPAREGFLQARPNLLIGDCKGVTDDVLGEYGLETAEMKMKKKQKQKQGPSPLFPSLPPSSSK
jgi:hypothetical protein